MVTNRTGIDPTAHDLPLGHINSCQICSSNDLQPILDLGHQPPCDSLLTAEQLNEAETRYPLRFLRCRQCGLAQIDHVVSPEILFHRAYPYRSGITATLATNLRKTAEATIERFNVGLGSLVVDIGSNDGTLLRGFADRGMKVLGIEATDIAKIANNEGIPTLQAFFSAEIAKRLVEGHGHASVVTATNMFAHVQMLGDLLRGVHHLLEEGGVFVSESHYLLDLIQTIQYDSIYHEHLKFYSLRPLQLLHRAHGFEITHVERIPNYGGSIRVYATKGMGFVSDQVGELEELEDRCGLYEPEVFTSFAHEVESSKRSLQQLLVELRRDGRTVAGIGCPGRASTLLNYCHVDRDLLLYIAEQSTSLKLGLFLPGMHIPIVDESILFEDPPDYALMLSWHYAEPIIKKLRQRGLNSKLILPLPSVEIRRA